VTEQLAHELPEDVPGARDELPGTEPTAAPAKPGIRFTDRVLVLGQNGSGKSVLINYVMSTGYRCQRFLVDTKDEFVVPGVTPARRLSEIDWDAPVIHYIDDRGDLREYNRLFALLMKRRAGRNPELRGRYGLVVCVHELNDLCGDNPSATPQWVNAYIRKGRAHGLGLLAGSQRPVNMPKSARTEAQHVFAFAPGFDPDDRPIVAKLLHVSERELDELLAQAAALSPSGEHSYLWFDKRAKRLVIRPPLPAAMRARSVVKEL
jgi:energy-coupling factor transporter ATP-binding protein EcfA2